LLLGFAAGPILGIFDPEVAFGALFRPIISLAVGLILFEGGLTLRFVDVRGTGAVVRNLVSIGALVTWLLSTTIGVFLVGIDFDVALLVGALLTLTGPTVVIPLLRHVRPGGPAGAILRWEGILIDPIGAMLAIVVFEAISGGEHATFWAIALEVSRTVAFGSGIGLIAGLLLARALERFLVPDKLHVPVTLGTVAVAFVGADSLQPESGLFAVTIMGIALANRRALDVDHIAEWKEHLSTILLSVLFVSIAAHLPLEPLTELGWRALLYAGLLIVVVRPLAVWVSTLGSGLALRDRAFLMAMAPRGIVVAAVSSELALQLGDAGGGGAIVALVFPTIVVTVLVYGLLSRPFARAIGVAEGDAQGALIVGADIVGREIGAALAEQGFEVLLVDTNARSTQNARTMGLPTFHGSVLSTRFAETADLHGLGCLLALLPSDEINRLAAQEFLGTFGRPNLYRTTPSGRPAGEHDPSEPGRLLFGATVTTEWLREQLRRGAKVKATKLTEQFGPEEYAERYGDRIVPLFVISPERELAIVTAEERPELERGCTVLSLVPDNLANVAPAAAAG
ncbi:MAG: sodium:proton antiporter, partial [Planctomycetes bacterium]|nr:sodium:proton antiporter [Planctomycetota bacterium]